MFVLVLKTSIKICTFAEQSMIFQIVRTFLISTVLITLLFSCGEKKSSVRYIAYVGRFTDANSSTPIKDQEKNKFDVLHQYVLEQYVTELNKELSGVQLQLKTFDCQRTASGADSIYKLIAADTTIIAIIDNTWGKHIGAAHDIIQRYKLPVIAMNADHNNVDFGQASIFTGNSDEVPEDLAIYINNALQEHNVNFITEQDYTLTQGYYEAFKNRNILINKIFSVSSAQTINPDSLAKITQDIKQYYAAYPEQKKKLLVINVHSNWGNELLQYLDKNLDDLRLIGHAYIANGDAIKGFGTGNNNELILITNPTDAMSQKVHRDLSDFSVKYPDVFSNVNAPLFVKRCVDAMSFIRQAIIKNDALKNLQKSIPNHKDLHKILNEHTDNISRKLTQDQFNLLRGGTLASENDIYSFDNKGVLVPELFFSRYHQGKLLSMSKQLNNRREIIPNLLFGMEIQDIYDLNIASNSFTADFYYWVKMDSSSEDVEKYISFQNMKSSESTREMIIENIDKGVLYRLYRVSGIFYVDYVLNDFPFDTQELSINIEILSPDDRLKISFDQSALMLDSEAIEKFKVSGWNKLETYITIDNLISKSIKGDPQGKPGTLKKFKNFIFRLIVERVALRSYLQIILPLILIGFVGVAILFIQDLSFENIGEVSVGIFFSIVAFSISLSEMIPNSNYLTRADLLFWLTFFVVFLSFVSVIILNSIYDAEYMKTYKLQRFRLLLAILYPALILYVLFV